MTHRTEADLAASSAEDQRQEAPTLIEVEERLRLALEAAARAESRARRAEDRLAYLASASPNACLCIDAQGAITFCNDAAERMFGYGKAELVGMSLEAIIPKAFRDGLRTGLANAANDAAYAGKPIELKALTRHGREIPIEISASSWTEDGTRHFGALVRDISDLQRQRDRLTRLAHYDLLTALPNRTLFLERADRLLGAGRPATIVLIDLDGFKDVNDNFGHRAGDQLLVQIALRLSERVGDTHTLGRLGGDEFAVLIDGELTESGALDFAQGLRACVAEPFSFGGRVVTMTCGVGFVRAPQHGTTTEDLMANADLALGRAKESGRNEVALYAPGMRQAAQRKLTLVSELRRASQRNEFELFYQPQVDLTSGEINGLEALLRWRHPERGLLSPAEFLLVLKRDAIASTVGDWILREVVGEAARLYRMGNPLRIGVNLFSVQLKAQGLADDLGALIKQAGIPADLIEVEITENTILRNDATILDTLNRLRALGVRIAFDDYGTGYASLSMLKRYPLTRLKIDRSFVQTLEEDWHDRAVVEAVLELGGKFGLEVIAEGIETEEHRALLLALGCRQGQGYLFGQPQPMAALLPRLGPPRPAQAS